MSLVPSRVQVRDEGVVQGSVRIVDFVGAGVSAAVSGGIATVTVAGGGGASLDAITAAVANQAGIANANFDIRWNWAKTTNTTNAFRFSESAAATGGTSTAGVPNQVLLYVDTLVASTMSPLSVYSRGSHVFSVSPSTAQILAASGNDNAPVYSFAGATTDGMYRTAGVVGIGVGGGTAFELTTTQAKTNTGSAATPAWSFIADLDTGAFRAAVNTYGIGVGGVENSRFASGIWQPSYGSADAVSYAINVRKSRNTVASPAVITTGDSLGISNYLAYVGTINTYQIAAYTEALSTGTIADTTTGVGGIYRIACALVGAEPAEIVRWQAAAATGGGWQIMDEADGDPTTTELDANDSVAVYNKNNKLVFAYNNAGTVTYVSLALDGSSTAWVHNTTAP